MGRLLLFAIILLGLCGCSVAQPPAAAPTPAVKEVTNVLNTLRQGHPRLICTDEDLARIKDTLARDETAKSYFESIRAEADKLLKTPDTIQHKLIGPRLLDQSRRCVSRVYTLALTYRLTGDKRYSDRALKEMLAAAGFPDWNPSHFLDTAEMTHALGIGYDWLYDAMTGEQRDTVRKAIVNLGLMPGKKVYDGGGWWAKCNHNWNQVCNGGLGIGALAIGDEEPAIAKEILTGAFKSLPLAMASYGPDGGWAEGPGYWGYATRYTVYFLASLETALGSDQGFSNSPGFDRAGLFRVHFSGPVGKTFNYADAGDGVGSASEMYWLAKRFDQPLYAWQQRQRATKPEALDLVWYDPQQKSPEEMGEALDAYFKGVQVAFFRSSWSDPEAIFVGFKGGDNKANHSHLDLGSFVLDALGQRWASDLGSDNYNMPGYFGKQRWTYYRLRTESHNTLLINSENQDPKAAAPILGFHAGAETPYAVADLTAAYKTAVTRLWRGMALVNRKAVLVQDEIQAEKPVEALWGMVTAAEVKCEGAKATLTLKGKTLQARILSPEGATFDTVSTQPAEPQKQNEGTRKLVVRLAGPVTEARIAVLLTPGEAAVEAPKVRPLEDWLAEAK